MAAARPEGTTVTTTSTITTITTTVDSPIGPLTLVASDGAVTRIMMDAQRHAPAIAPEWTRDDAWFASVAAQLHAYFARELTTFDIPMRLDGTPFQQRVWHALTEIPFGTTQSYGEIARRVGSPDASRAVGLANGRNPIAIVVPCHRVVGSNGNLIGYGGGLDRKRWLLAHEAGLPFAG